MAILIIIMVIVKLETFVSLKVRFRARASDKTMLLQELIQKVKMEKVCRKMQSV